VPCTHSLDPKTHLRAIGLSSSTALTCPTCRAEFPATTGAKFPTTYYRGEEACYGPVIFCSPVCVLAWFAPQELGHKQ
jgi:hypothetical protein